MKKLGVLLIAMIVMLSIFVLPVSAEDGVDTRSLIVDEYDHLTASEETEIIDKLRIAEEETDIIFIVAIYDVKFIIPSGVSVVEECGFDINLDNIVLLIIESGDYVNYYEMFTWGVADTVVTDSAVDSILDDNGVHKNLKGGDFAPGILAFIDKTVDSIKSYRTGLIIGIIVFALVAAGVSVGSVIYVYKKKLKSPSYPVSDYADLNLTEHTDIFLGKTVTRTKISSSSSGGGRSGGGGGSRGRR